MKLVTYPLLVCYQYLNWRLSTQWNHWIGYFLSFVKNQLKLFKNHCELITFHFELILLSLLGILKISILITFRHIVTNIILYVFFFRKNHWFPYFNHFLKIQVFKLLFQTYNSGLEAERIIPSKYVTNILFVDFPVYWKLLGFYKDISWNY